MLTRFPCLCRPYRNPTSLFFLKSYSTTSDEVEIILPKRIPRGPTDILRALESTIKRDPTAAHYKYHDDPFLIPTSNLAKRTYALSQESGRKAAHWVRQENRDLFFHTEADPMIPAFVPKMVYESNTVIEEDLQKVIKDALVSDAVTIYNFLMEKGITISSGTKQALLELLCYYNHNDPSPEEFIEERWFRQSNKGKERQRKTWKDGGLAEELFITLENPNVEAYCALIQGMVKHGQIDRAFQLYEEAQQKSLLVSTDTHNTIISAASFIREGNDLRWNLIVDILTAMRQAQVKPNLGTLNSILKALSMMGMAPSVRIRALQTLVEFKNLGIEPSLASFYYVLITCCKERGPRNQILIEIMNYVEGKEFQIRDGRDTYFFVTAIDVCRYHLHDKEVAKRIHNLLHLGNNYDLIGDSFKESIYYRHYLSLMCEGEPFDYFMENIYRPIVPHIYIPEPSVLVEILKCLEVQGTIEYLPSLWSDVVIFDQTDRKTIVYLFLDIMVNNPNSVELLEKFVSIAWDIWLRAMERDQTGVSKLEPTGDMLGKIMTILLRNKNIDKAGVILDALDKDQSIVGVPSFESLTLFVDNCIEHKLPNKAISCIQYAVDHGFEDVVNLAISLNKSLTLDENHLKKLNRIFGYDFLNSNV